MVHLGAPASCATTATALFLIQRSSGSRERSKGRLLAMTTQLGSLQLCCCCHSSARALLLVLLLLAAVAGAAGDWRICDEGVLTVTGGEAVPAVAQPGNEMSFRIHGSLGEPESCF